MEIKCYYCEHEWDYQRQSQTNKYLTCPKCRYRLKLSKLNILNNQSQLAISSFINKSKSVSQSVSRLPIKILPKIQIPIQPKPKITEPVVTFKIEEPKKEIKEFTNLFDFNLAVLENKLS